MLDKFEDISITYKRNSNNLSYLQPLIVTKKTIEQLYNLKYRPENFSWDNVRKVLDEMNIVLNKEILQQAIAQCDDVPPDLLKSIVLSAKSNDVLFSALKNPQLTDEAVILFILDACPYIHKQIKLEFEKTKSSEQPPFSNSVISVMVSSPIFADSFLGQQFRFLKNTKQISEMIEVETLSPNNLSHIINNPYIDEATKKIAFFAGCNINLLNMDENTPQEIIQECKSNIIETIESVKENEAENLINCQNLIQKMLKEKQLTHKEQKELYEIAEIISFTFLSEDDPRKKIMRNILDDMMKYGTSQLAISQTTQISKTLSNENLQSSDMLSLVKKLISAYNKVKDTNDLKVQRNIIIDLLEIYKDKRLSGEHLREANEIILQAFSDYARNIKSEINALFREMIAKEDASIENIQKIKELYNKYRDSSPITEIAIALREMLTPQIKIGIFESNHISKMIKTIIHYGNFTSYIDPQYYKTNIQPIIKTLYQKTRSNRLSDLDLDIKEIGEDMYLFKKYEKFFTKNYTVFNIEEFFKEYDTKEKRKDFYQSLTTSDILKLINIVKEQNENNLIEKILTHDTRKKLVIALNEVLAEKTRSLHRQQITDDFDDIQI